MATTLRVRLLVGARPDAPAAEVDDLGRRTASPAVTLVVPVHALAGAGWSTAASGARDVASIEVEAKANGERRYLVRYRTPTHAQRKRLFRRRADAERFKAAVEHSKTEGLFIDPKAGRQTFGE
jgi:hypothetical protein